MKKIFVLLMVLLSVCSAAFAEGVEDVLKDCKLDRNRWKVVEWFKAEKFVRFFDSKSVVVTGQEQFDVVIYDYYYGDACEKSSCKLQGKRHYHSEKWGFNTKVSKGTLRSLATKDADENVVESYDYPASMQVATDIKRNSIEGKVMQKAKEVAKNDKKFEPKEPVPPKDPNPSTDATPQKGFAPLPQPIGSTDSEGYIYLGRFTGEDYSSYVETIMHLMPYNNPAERDDVYDVYYYHKHGLNGTYEDGYGCKIPGTDVNAGDSYCCVLKFIPLDKHGNRVQRQGVYVQLISMGHTSKGASVYSVSKVRLFDTATHKLAATKFTVYDNKSHDEVERTTGDLTIRARLNPVGNNGKTDYSKMMFMLRVVHDSPYGHAMKHSNCPTNLYRNR